MKEPNRAGEETSRNEAENEPQVFSVHKGPSGWKFNRRDFLIAASGAIASAAGCTAGEGSPTSQSVMVITKIPEVDAGVADSPTAAAPTVAAPTSTPRPTSTQAPTSTATPTAKPTATSTSTPTVTPTPVPSAKFITDVTIPDNTIVEPGHAFTKTWRVENDGVVPWGEGTNLKFGKGDQMEAESPVSAPEVEPGKSVDISVDMVAPTESGIHSAEWLLEDGSGLDLLLVTVVICVASTEVIPPGQEGIEFSAPGIDGETRTFTLPCGSPIPPGAVCVCNCVAASLPGDEGEVLPGETGINFVGPSGESRTMPCGSPIPDGWTCSCNCVSAPPACSCVGDCSCDGVGTHYWHPN